MTRTKGLLHDTNICLLHSTDIWSVTGFWSLDSFMTPINRLLRDTNIWSVAWHSFLDFCMNRHLHVAWHLHMGCCLTPTSERLHDTDLWFIARQIHGHRLLHDTNLRSVVWHWPMDYCMTLLSGLFSDLWKVALNWQIDSCITQTNVCCMTLALDCCMAPTTGLLHDTDIWSVAWHWHMGCCMTLNSGQKHLDCFRRLTFGLLYDYHF
jgi:hypothetical protein